jgi:Ca2+-binding EF-hand superfamily protein
MGAHHSGQQFPDWESLCRETTFTKKELEALTGEFRRLSRSHVRDGVIDFAEFQAAVGIANEDFCWRLFEIIDANHSRFIDAGEFIRALAVLSPGAPVEKKAEFCFQAYDLDNEGVITARDLTTVFGLGMGSATARNMTRKAIEKAVDTEIDRMDRNGDGMISFPEFLAEVQLDPTILDCVTIHFKALLPGPEGGTVGQ